MFKNITTPAVAVAVAGAVQSGLYSIENRKKV